MAAVAKLTDRRMLRLTLIVFALSGLGLAPAGVSDAATSAVDFETGPPIGQAIENDYISSAFVFWRLDDPGFRPYRRTAGVPTASGAVAADIGPDHCLEETAPSNCEFPIPGTWARLTSPAVGVTLYAGLFSSVGSEVTATLTGYDSAGNPVAASTAPIGVGITTPITISSSGGITSFGLVGGAPGPPGRRSASTISRSSSRTRLPSAPPKLLRSAPRNVSCPRRRS